jgi:hypothetical protein
MFSRVKRMSRGGWITCGVVLGAIIAPSAALAAFSDIRIVGVSGGPVAQVTPANQLRTAEIDPSRHRRFVAGGFGSSGGCQSFAAPAGNSLMLRQIQIDPFLNPNPGLNDNVAIYVDKTCTDFLTSVRPTTIDPITIPLEPGVGIKSGGGFSVRVAGNIITTVTWLGYTMPSSAVPVTTPGVRKGSTRRALSR